MAKKKEPIITDIISSYFKDENGVEKEKRSYMNGSKIVKEEIVNS